MASANPFADVFEPEEDFDPTYVPGKGRPDFDYSVFKEANRRGRLRTNADHVGRLAMVRRQFPSADFGEGEWRGIFRQRPEVFKAICKVLVEADAAEENPGRPGNRPRISYADASRRLLRLFGKEYSLLPFDEAFKVLCRGRSLNTVARRTGLPRSQVWRLQRGDTSPTGEMMERVAAAFGAHPSYFVEYRTAWVLAALADTMSSSPETSMSLYSTIVHS